MNKINQILCKCECGGGSNEAKENEISNLPGLTSLIFRAGTHSSFKAKMLKALSVSESLEGHSTREDDDSAIATLDAWATVLDIISFYQERIINEGYLRTATERLSVLELARHINYKLNPGVAAGTYLAFKMNEAIGAPEKATIPKGTKVQSIPEQGQLPQIFEIIQELEARVEWNNIKLQTKKRIIPEFGDTEIYLKGINTELKPGDGLLLIGDERKNNPENENWDFRKVKEVIPYPNLKYTRITWDKGLGAVTFGNRTEPAKENFKVYALRQRVNLFGYNAPDFRAMSEDIKDTFNPDTSSNTNKNSNTDWKGFNIMSVSYSGHPHKIKTIHLDSIYPKIANGSWLVISADEYEEVYEVNNVVESSRKDFTLASKTLALTLSGENLKEKFNDHLRDAVIFAQSEELEIAEKPVNNSIKNFIELKLEKIVTDLTEEKLISISGKRKRLKINELKSGNYCEFKVNNNQSANRKLSPGDSLIILGNTEKTENGKTLWKLKDSGGNEGIIEVKDEEYSIMESRETDDIVREINSIKIVKRSLEPTTVILQDELENYFDPATVSINANIVKANHGETKKEIIGSGDGSRVFQKFTLKQKPLTYVSASTTSGTESTLQIRVNDIHWKEVPSFYGRNGNEKIYTTTIDNDGVITVRFGDGITGSRLPTGSENIQATYRVGIGKEGLLNAGQLSMLMTPQLGVSEVVNPLPATGGVNQESLINARRNAPLTVLTLDRIVSVKDYEDIARAFPGIGKARADVVWNGEKQVVFLTIAAEEEKPVNKESDLYKKLSSMIKKSGQLKSTVYIENYTPVSFSVNVRISIEENCQFKIVEDNVRQSLIKTFSFKSRNFGQDVTPGEVIAAIQQVEGVKYTDLEHLDGKEPFSELHFRLSPIKAMFRKSTLGPAKLLTNKKSYLAKSKFRRPIMKTMFKESTLQPAELLTIDKNNIIITEILS